MGFFDIFGQPKPATPNVGYQKFMADIIAEANKQKAQGTQPMPAPVPQPRGLGQELWGTIATPFVQASEALTRPLRFNNADEQRAWEMGLNGPTEVNVPGYGKAQAAIDAPDVSSAVLNTALNASLPLDAYAGIRGLAGMGERAAMKAAGSGTIEAVDALRARAALEEAAKAEEMGKALRAKSIGENVPPVRNIAQADLVTNPIIRDAQSGNIRSGVYDAEVLPSPEKQAQLPPGPAFPLLREAPADVGKGRGLPIDMESMQNRISPTSGMTPSQRQMYEDLLYEQRAKDAGGLNLGVETPRETFSTKSPMAMFNPEGANVPKAQRPASLKPKQKGKPLASQEKVSAQSVEQTTSGTSLSEENFQLQSLLDEATSLSEQRMQGMDTEEAEGQLRQKFLKLLDSVPEAEKEKVVRLFLQSLE